MISSFIFISRKCRYRKTLTKTFKESVIIPSITTTCLRHRSWRISNTYELQSAPKVTQTCRCNAVVSRCYDKTWILVFGQRRQIEWGPGIQVGFFFSSFSLILACFLLILQEIRVIKEDGMSQNCEVEFLVALLRRGGKNRRLFSLLRAKSGMITDVLFLFRWRL